MELRSLTRVIARAVAWIAAGSAILFGYLTWSESRYPYNELGRYFDGIVVHFEQDVEMYAFLATLSFVIAFGLFRLTRRPKAA